MENNLKKIKEMYNLTNEQLQKVLDVDSLQTVKNYLSGTSLPIKKAILLSEYAENKKKKEDKNYEIDSKNFLSLDWIYCRSPYMNERDTMSDVLFSLTKILKLGRRKTKFGNDNVLVVDSRFREFLYDINGLASSRSIYLDMSDENYNSLRKDIYNKHAPNLRRIFSDFEYLDNNATEIHKIETSHDFNYDELFDILAEPKIEEEVKKE